ncbi:MAG: hypothetical protein GY822_08565 [Deltaproteobacteria bacterium]|nr:hypothetical protein [Deltaproteobacteria bacterium]
MVSLVNSSLTTSRFSGLRVPSAADVDLQGVVLSTGKVNVDGRLTGDVLQLSTELPVVAGDLSVDLTEIIRPIALSQDYSLVLPQLVVTTSGGLLLSGNTLIVNGDFPSNIGTCAW